MYNEKATPAQVYIKCVNLIIADKTKFKLSWLKNL